MTIPKHKHRPRSPAWTKKQKLRMAQSTSERQREAPKVTMPKLPWEETKQEERKNE